VHGCGGPILRFARSWLYHYLSGEKRVARLSRQGLDAVRPTVLLAEAVPFGPKA